MYSIHFKDDQREIGREDAVWYTDGNRLPIVKVVGDKSVIFVYSVGETRIALFEKPNYKGEPTILKKPKDLISHNINDDKDIFELSEVGKIEWINNPWFELHIEYEDDTVYRVHSLEYVSHTLSEAISMAIEFSYRTFEQLVIGV